MEVKDRLVIVVPGDDPVQIQGSSHLERLKPYGEVVVYTDRPLLRGRKAGASQGRSRHHQLAQRGQVVW